MREYFEKRKEEKISEIKVYLDIAVARYEKRQTEERKNKIDIINSVLSDVKVFSYNENFKNEQDILNKLREKSSYESFNGQKQYI